MILMLYALSAIFGVGACAAVLLAAVQGQETSGLNGAAQILQLRPAPLWSLALILAGASMVTAFGARLLTRLEELIEAVRQPKVSIRIPDAAPTPPPMAAVAPPVTQIPFPRPKLSSERNEPSI